MHCSNVSVINMATSSGSESPSLIKYHRRNDRTPEKQPQALTELDRKRISQIRAGIEHARKKANVVNESTYDRCEQESLILADFIWSHFRRIHRNYYYMSALLDCEI